MFDNIGKKIKGLAVALFILEAIASFVVGVVFLADGGEEEALIGLLILFSGFFVSWISSWFLYGFGEIIDKLQDIERNTRGEHKKSEAQPKVDYERINKIEKLRSQGLITEEEYQQAISKSQQEI